MGSIGKTGDRGEDEWTAIGCDETRERERVRESGGEVLEDVWPAIGREWGEENCKGDGRRTRITAAR